MVVKGLDSSLPPRIFYSRTEVEYAPTVCTAGWKTLPNHLHPILVRAELEGKKDSSTTEVTITLTNPWTDTT